MDSNNYLELIDDRDGVWQRRDEDGTGTVVSKEYIPSVNMQESLLQQLAACYLWILHVYKRYQTCGNVFRQHQIHHIFDSKLAMLT